MAKRRLLYLEFDGQVFLVQRDGGWTFPNADEKFAFEYSVRHTAKIGDAEVAFCRPDLRAFPTHWVYKDDVPMRTDVDPVVQRAINASLARCVVGLLLEDGRGKILLVKSCRGFTKGMWNIPGGFIEYGEEPTVAAVREAREETGLDIELGELIGVYTKRFESPYFMYGFMYSARARSTRLTLDPTEIEAAKWFEPATAHAETLNPFAKQAIEARFGVTARPEARRSGPRRASA